MDGKTQEKKEYSNEDVPNKTFGYPSQSWIYYWNVHIVLE